MFTRGIRLLCQVALLIGIISPPTISGAARSSEFSLQAALIWDSPAQNANQLASAVNQLRESRGLGALNVHPILMQNAQQHANYMAATGNITHLSADGLRPFQRALAAGYSVAGDLSLGGFFSENILSAPGLTAQQVVDAWMSDEPHANSMLSPNRSDIGAGVAFSGGFAYFVIDTGLQSSRPIQFTPSSGDVISQDPIVLAPGATSTPQSDGSIAHTVHSGETLWTIAGAYKVSIEQITTLNRLNRDRFIYPGDQLIIQLAQTATPTLRPTSTPRTPRPSRTPTLPRMPTQPVQESSDNGLVLGLYLFAVIVFVIFVWLEFRSRKNPSQ